MRPCPSSTAHLPHSSSQTKQQIVSRVEEQVEANLGTAMMYTLFEWAKENQESLMDYHQPVITVVVSGLASLCGRGDKRAFWVLFRQPINPWLHAANWNKEQVFSGKVHIKKDYPDYYCSINKVTST